jgi:hypothetical protein
MPARLLWPAAIAALALIAGLALARPTPGVITLYYDEHGHVVGARGWRCDAAAIEWGQATTRSRSLQLCRR